MNKDEREQLRHEVYTLWYNEEDPHKKQVYRKVLDLMEYAEEMRSSIKAVASLSSGLL